jgi:hypothetical protein
LRRPERTRGDGEENAGAEALDLRKFMENHCRGKESKVEIALLKRKFSVLRWRDAKDKLKGIRKELPPSSSRPQRRGIELRPFGPKAGLRSTR